MAGEALLPIRWLLILAVLSVQLVAVIWFSYAAYKIRMYPIEDFGYIIHEFDPWFNYRATEYLAEHGLAKFFKWYDYDSWYPIGRPIGTTIFPGMQMTAVAIWEGMKFFPLVTYDVPGVLHRLLSSVFGQLQGYMFVPPIPMQFHFEAMTINQICCMIPPWFGVIASLFLGLVTYEVSRSMNAAVVGVGIMAVIPAHLMRSVGGKFDNEAVAMAAICSTFYFWLRSVRTPRSWPIGVLAGLSYIYMVAAWGGYIFVLNMIGVHAIILVGLGRFNTGVHLAYSLFFIIGTAGAIQIPVVGWTPLRSVEQLGPFGVFVGYQVLAFCDWHRRRRGMETEEFVRFRLRTMLGLIVAVAAVVFLLAPMGYFGPLSSRIRGLFVKHTKTGNPLVDSVAEHQPASAGIYMDYLNLPLDYCAFGAIVCCFNRNNAAYFVALYGIIASHFSGKMSRLVLICAPIVSMVCAIWVGAVLDFLMRPFWLLLGAKGYTGKGKAIAAFTEKASSDGASNPNGNGKASKKKGGEVASAKKAPAKKKVCHKDAAAGLEEWQEELRPGGAAAIKHAIKQTMFEFMGEEAKEQVERARVMFDSFEVVSLRAAFSMCLLFLIIVLSDVPPKISTFVRHCDGVARSMSTAQVMYKVRSQGRQVLVDDYWQGYKWIEKNTPKDARVMAWWDYGYQITGIAKRTSMADGNTWNHEHIATLGRMLTSPQRRAHKAIKHFADYVLVWAGEGGDDLSKSPHLARIGNSVYPDHCGDDDPGCTKFGFNKGDRLQPTPMMRRSLLFNLVKHNEQPGAKADPECWEEVHTTKNGLMRIFKVLNVSQESKAWVADPANRICDAPGSWYCVGQYPPAVQKMIEKRRSFSQVEDFNKQGEKSAYTKMIEKERAGREL